MTERPLLFVDVDGVISVFGFESAEESPGPFHWIDGIAHCISSAAGPRLRRLARHYDFVWATGWEEKANEYLPRLLELPEPSYPSLRFDGNAVWGQAHWKLGPLEAHAGERPAAWIDDSFDDECRAWALARSAPTLLVQTESPVGITDGDVELLLGWAEELAASP